MRPRARTFPTATPSSVERHRRWSYYPRGDSSSLSVSLSLSFISQQASGRREVAPTALNRPTSRIGRMATTTADCFRLLSPPRRERSDVSGSAVPVRRSAEVSRRAVPAGACDHERPSTYETRRGKVQARRTNKCQLVFGERENGLSLTTVALLSRPFRAHRGRRRNAMQLLSLLPSRSLSYRSRSLSSCLSPANAIANKSLSSRDSRVDAAAPAVAVGCRRFHCISLYSRLLT